MIQAPSFDVACPSCGTEFPVDPAKVPAAGVHAICSSCQRVFAVEAPAEVAAPRASGADEAALTTEFERDAVGAVSDEPSDTAGVGVEEPFPEDVLDVADEVEPADVEAPPAAEAAEPTSKADEPAALRDEPAAAAEAEPAARTAAEPLFEDLSSLTSEAMADEGLDDQLANSALSLAADRFGRRDPGERARRLARVLVSDIIAYFPARYRESLARGTVKEDFEDEVKKSWKEYVDQVGLEVAESTPHFEDALNEILGKGEKIF